MRSPVAGARRRVAAATARTRARATDAVLARRAARGVVHVRGPRRPDVAPDEIVVVSIVRNGAPYLPAWLRHHDRLGVRHYVVLDNGSTDGTPDILGGRDDVTLLRTDLRYATYENHLKRHLVHEYATSRWSLFVDADELWDYPGSSRRSIPELLAYLRERGATAVIAQMLDFVADRPLSQIPPDADIEATSPYIDLSAIRTAPYEFSGGSDVGIPFHRGGIRATVFGTDNGLTKVPLVLAGQGVRTFVAWHHVEGARLADFSTVLRHYPFSVRFVEKVAEAVRTERYGTVTSEYRGYHEVLRHRPDLSLRLDTAIRYEGVDQLLALGFLQASPAYRRWMQA